MKKQKRMMKKKKLYLAHCTPHNETHHRHNQTHHTKQKKSVKCERWTNWITKAHATKRNTHK